MLNAPALLLCEYAAQAELEPAGGWQLADAQAQQRVQQFTNPAARTRFALSRLLLAKATAQLLDDTTGWQLQTQESGQPVLRSPSGQINLSISHTQGLVALAMAPAGQCIGVDVEAWARPLRLQTLLAASMSLEDAQWCRTQPSPEQAFLRHWTLKEAYLKALGCGIAADLGGLSFAVGEQGIHLCRTPYPDERYWLFAQPSVLTEHCLSLASASPFPIDAAWQQSSTDQSLQLPGCKVNLLRLH
ncbi:4'-phosphopantetheinyl transferase family protein [Halopseudomonas sp.]|uniref:4'-phosphopantetheinyl transferase family protein n=1 Tax=Halopseudomonas sp. TaxID=2901191 RepID=UPI0030015B0B